MKGASILLVLLVLTPIYTSLYCQRQLYQCWSTKDDVCCQAKLCNGSKRRVCGCSDITCPTTTSSAPSKAPTTRAPSKAPTTRAPSKAPTTPTPYVVSGEWFDTRDDAEKYCQNLSGGCRHLASIHDDDQLNNAQSVCGYVYPCFIGLSQNGADESWKWNDGTAFSYGNTRDGQATTSIKPWGSNEPATWFYDYGEESLCVHLFYHEFATFPCDMSNWFYALCGKLDHETGSCHLRNEGINPQEDMKKTVEKPFETPIDPRSSWPRIYTILGDPDMNQLVFYTIIVLSVSSFITWCCLSVVCGDIKSKQPLHNLE